VIKTKEKTLIIDKILVNFVIRMVDFNNWMRMGRLMVRLSREFELVVVEVAESCDDILEIPSFGL
jgi:hypothetical protein